MPAKKDYSKIAGRLVLGRISGYELDETTRQGLRDGTIGGIVLFKENANSLEQVAALCQEIIEISHHPPIIAVDQEGGAVQRLESILTPLPSQMALAASQKEEFITQCATINAKQCKALGINCLLAPVLDVLTNNLNPVIGTRSFGSNEQQVAQFSKLMLQSIAKEGITPVGKHFPGHGSTLEDSHLSLAVNPNDETAIWKTDLLPFRECLSDLPALLVGHVWLKSVDEEPLPATLSNRIINRVLRGFLEYDGIVISDDLTMKAITERWGLKEAALLALEATTDLLLVCAKPEETLAVSKHIADSIKSGKLKMNSIDQSLRRLQKRFGTRLQPLSKEGLVKLKEEIAEETELTLTASAASIALLTRGLPEFEGENPLIEPARGTWKNPIQQGLWTVLAPKHPRYHLGLLRYLEELSLASEDQRKQSAVFEERRYALDPTEEEALQVANDCMGKQVIYLTFRSVTNSGQAALAELLRENASQVVTVACDSPFDIAVVRGFKHHLATFDPSELGMRGLACVLLGIIEPFGACPVDLKLQISEKR